MMTEFTLNVVKLRPDLAVEIVETVREPLLVLDSELKVVMANRSFYATFKTRPDETLGRHIYHLGNSQWAAPTLRELLEEVLPRCQNFDDYEVNHEFPAIGSRIMLLNARRLSDSHGNLILVAIEDVTEKRAIERIRAAKERAEEAALWKDRLISLVSHDLRSPLSGIIGMLEMIRCECGGPLSAKTLDLLDRSIAAVRHLVLLIEDLLSASRIKGGKLVLRQAFFDAQYLGAMMRANYLHSAALKGIAINNKIQTNSRVYGDKALLGEAVQNLVTNAIKFCREGDAITISFDRTDNAITVEDNGPGISAELLSRILGGAESTTTLGTAGEVGIGLGIRFVQEIMELHKGKLDVTSESRRGSRFRLFLPTVRPRVLVAMADERFRARVKEMVSVLDVEIHTPEPDDTFAEVIRWKPHLVVAEAEAQGLDGLDLLRRFRMRSDTADLPIIMICGDFGNGIRESVSQLGTSDFLTKTDMSFDDLLSRIRRYIA